MQNPENRTLIGSAAVYARATFAVVQRSTASTATLTEAPWAGGLVTPALSSPEATPAPVTGGGDGPAYPAPLLRQDQEHGVTALRTLSLHIPLSCKSQQLRLHQRSHASEMHVHLRKTIHSPSFMFPCESLASSISTGETKNASAGSHSAAHRVQLKSSRNRGLLARLSSLGKGFEGISRKLATPVALQPWREGAASGRSHRGCWRNVAPEGMRITMRGAFASCQTV
jgi:hypothetical protein